MLEDAGKRGREEGAMRFTYWLNELDATALQSVGKKCANLGEMTRKGLAVPPGFAIGVDAYEHSLRETGLGSEIAGIIAAAEPIRDDIDELEQLSRVIRDRMESHAMPAALAAEVGTKYLELCQSLGLDGMDVAVRSSGAVSMPGSYETYLHVCGVDDVLEKVIKVWSSSFNARSFVFKLQKNMSLGQTPIGVAVIKMVNAKAAGVLFTVNPLTGDRAKMVVEANYGLGESVVSGKVGPDRFRINRITGEIEERVLGAKEEECVADKEKGGIVFKAVEEKRRQEYCLSDEELLRLMELGKQVEAAFGRVPQDIEWAIDRDLPKAANILLLQARPEQTYAKRVKPERPEQTDGMKYISNFLTQGVKISQE